jgi:hypothetical protein
VRKLLAFAAGVSALAGCSTGTGWHRLDFASAPGDAVADVLPGPHWLAVGSHGPQPRWWQDGRRRALAYEPFSDDGRRTRLLSVAQWNGATAAVGYATSPVHGNQRPVLWLVENGALRETYLLRELFGGPRLMSTGRMAAGPQGFLATGTRTGVGDRQTAQVWRAAPPPDWQRIDDQPALASTGPTEQVWGFDVAAGPSRAVVAGRADLYGNGGTNPSDAAAWYSDDGRTWQRARGLDGQPGAQELDRVAVSAGGFVAVGRDRGRLATWTSSDGATWRLLHHFADVAIGQTTPVDIASDGTVAVVTNGRLRLVTATGRTVRAPRVEHPATSAAIADNLIAVTTAHGVEVFSRLPPPRG